MCPYTNFDQSISCSAKQTTAPSEVFQNYEGPSEVFQNYEFNYNKPNQCQAQLQ